MMETPGETGKADDEHAVRSVWIWLAAYLLFRSALTVIRLPPQTVPPVLIGAAAISAFGAIGLPIGIITALLSLRLPRSAAMGLAAAGLLLWIGLLLGLRITPRELVAGSLVFQDLGKILAAAGVGIALAACIREVNLLLPAGMFAAFADFVVVHYGTVKQALAPGNTKGQALVQAISAHAPAIHPAIPHFTIGPADFLFLGLFLGCAARFGMGVKRNAVILTVVLAVSLLLVPIIGSVPALAPMSIAFVAVNWRSFRLTRDEVISTAVVLAVIGALFFGYFQAVYPQK